MEYDLIPTEQLIKHLLEDGSVSFRVEGHSMMPWLQSGDLVEVGKRKRYWPGDVVIIRNMDRDQLMAHRLLGYYWKPGQGWKAITRGDARESTDASILIEEILGCIIDGNRTREVSNVSLAIRFSAVANYLGVMVNRIFS